MRAQVPPPGEAGTGSAVGGNGCGVDAFGAHSRAGRHRRCQAVSGDSFLVPQSNAAGKNATPLLQRHRHATSLSCSIGTARSPPMA